MSNSYIVSTEDLQALLSAWIEAEKAITTGQNYSIEGQSVSRADLQMVTERINQLSRELAGRQQAAQGQKAGVITPSW